MAFSDCGATYWPFGYKPNSWEILPIKCGRCGTEYRYYMSWKTNKRYKSGQYPFICHRCIPNTNERIGIIKQMEQDWLFKQLSH